MILGLTVACGTQDVLVEEQGLTVLEAERASLKALYRNGETQLILSSKLVGDEVISTVEDPQGLPLTRLKLSLVDGRVNNNIRISVEHAAAESITRLTSLSHDPNRLAELMGAYRGAAEALQNQIPADSRKLVRDALLMHPTVLSTTLLHLDPQTLKQALPSPRLPMKAMRMEGDTTDDTTDDTTGDTTGGTTGGTTEVECAGCAPNDDTEDYYAAPVYEVTYYAQDEIPVSDAVTAERLQTYYEDSCHGACGPGCGWCANRFGVYFCYTNAFCTWHDDHCGAYSHFFSCSIRPSSIPSSAY